MHAQEILTQWMDHLNGGRPDDAVALYAADATLVPTFSANTVNSHEGIQGYFDSLSQHPDLDVVIHEQTVCEQALTEQIFILTGLYTFCFTVEGQRRAFEARFTFVIDLSLSSPIRHHHSSQIPRAPG